jgi:hypothetical protein
VTVDTQASRVYAWEYQWGDWNVDTVKLSQVRAYVRWACGLYGIRYPSVRQHDKLSCTYSWSHGRKISILEGQNNCATALHEVAHYIGDSIFGGDMPHHSPQWMAIYLWLLSAAKVAPKTALFASAKANGITWVPLWQVSPKRLAGLAGKRLPKRKIRPPAR